MSEIFVFCKKKMKKNKLSGTQSLSKSHVDNTSVIFLIRNHDTQSLLKKKKQKINNKDF